MTANNKCASNVCPVANNKQGVSRNKNRAAVMTWVPLQPYIKYMICQMSTMSNTQKLCVSLFMWSSPLPSQMLPCTLTLATCTELPVCPLAGSGAGIRALPRHGGWHVEREVRVEDIKPQGSSCALAPFGLVRLTHFFQQKQQNEITRRRHHSWMDCFCLFWVLGTKIEQLSNQLQR